MIQAGTSRICHNASHYFCTISSMLFTFKVQQANLNSIYNAAMLESAGQLLSLSTPPSQPHASANTEDGMGRLHQSAGDQSAGMPAIPASPLMATPHHVATMHVGKPQPVMLTSNTGCLCYSSMHLSIPAMCIKMHECLPLSVLLLCRHRQSCS